MKNKETNLFKLAFMLLLLGSVFVKAQTTVTVNYFDESNQVFSVEESGKLFFNDDNLMINTNGTNTTSIPVELIKRITFSEETMETTELTTENLVLYPNPATNFIRIQSNSGELIDVKIYSMQGQLLLSGKYFSSENIDVSSLEKGIYVVKADKSNLKMIKK